MDEIAINQVDRRLDRLRRVLGEAQVVPGWIYYMRHALKLTLENLAKISGLSKASIQQMEKREAEGRITIATLRKMAHSMECELMYAFVPQKGIKKIVFDKACKKAEELIRNADIHMTLEDQKVIEDMELRIKRLANELIARRDIW